MIVRTKKDLDKIIDILKTTKIIAFDTEYEDYGFPDVRLVGMSFSWNGKDGAYIPVGHRTNEMQLDKAIVVGAVKPILEDMEKTIIMHNAKADIQSMWCNDVYIQDSPYWNKVMPSIKVCKEPDMTGFSYSPSIPETHIFDTMIAKWLLDCTKEYGLKASVRDLLNYKMTELSDLTKKKLKLENGKDVLLVGDVTIKDLGEYAWDDAVQTYRLYEYLKAKIEEANLEKVFYELEMPMVNVLAEMEIFGAPVNPVLLKDYGKEINAKMQEYKQKIFDLTPNKEEFNLNSTKQLNEILFTQLRIPPVGEPNKKGEYSTKAEILEEMDKKYSAYLAGHNRIGEKYEIVHWILKYRELVKLYGTYIEGMGGFIDEDYRIHCNFWQTGTKTGRLSSSKPNLQNIPNNAEFPLRKCFYAPTKEYADKYGLRFNEPHDWKWCTFDESQLELRVGAHLTKDPVMLDLFNNNGDMHSMTAKGCYHLDCEADEVKDKYPIARKKAKKVNFGIFYGMGAKSLSAGVNRELDNPKDYMTEDEANEVIQNFLRTYRYVGKFMDTCKEYATRYGKIKMITGRYRILEYINTDPRKIKDKDKRAIAFIEKNKDERRAVNSPIQGSGADIVALAMRNIRKKFMESNDWAVNAKMVLQVHDEISFLLKDGLHEELAKIVKYEMEVPVKLRVPLVSEGSVGESWFDCH